MKSVRLTSVLGLFVFSGIAVLWTLGIISGDDARDISVKSLGVVGILMLATVLTATLLKGSPPPDTTKNNSSGGPQF